MQTTQLALLLFPCLLLSSCGSPNESQLETKLAGYDSFFEQLPHKFYEPGMGDVMNGVQLRHAKLWSTLR